MIRFPCTVQYYVLLQGTLYQYSVGAIPRLTQDLGLSMPVSSLPPSPITTGYVLTNHHIPILIKLNLYGMLVRILRTSCRIVGFRIPKSL